MTKVLVPGQAFPAIDLPKVGGGRITNADFDAPFMTVLNVYRGLHCPRCKRQLEDFMAHEDAIQAEGLKIVSISTDDLARAEQTVAEWGLGDWPVGCDLSIAEARGLGLSISETIREGEPALFAEAAVFFIRADGVLWGAAVNTFPFLRPTAEQIIDAAQTAHARSYPPRGNVPA